MAIGAILCGGCTMALRYASNINHIYWWSFLIGVSSAFVYIPALTAAQQWYPHKRGLVSGLVNFVFAFSAALISPVFVQLLNYLTHNEIAFIMGLTALVCGLAGGCAYFLMPIDLRNDIPGVLSGFNKLKKVQIFC
jgi:OFA family oxalate/formate antiporter-like MFS transporter